MRAQLTDYRHLGGGKVRELYEIDAGTLLLVATDRISAYDHILPSPIPDKGRVLTAMSFFFFDALGVATPAEDHGVDAADWSELIDRALEGERGRNFIGRRTALV